MSLTDEQFKEQHLTLLEQKHMDTINNIKQLQDLEKYMFQNLEKINNQDSSDVHQQQQIIARINELSQMRTGLFNQLKNMYSSTQSELNDQRHMLADQLSVVGIVENELNKAKQNLTALTNDKNNKLRLVEIGNYESSRYKAHIGVMQIIAVSSLILLVLSFLLQRGYLPSNVSSGLILITLVVAVVLVLNRVFDIMSRSNLDFDKYNFYYDKAQMQPGYETVIEHDRKFFHKLGGQLSSDFGAAKDELNQTLQGLKQTADSVSGQISSEIGSASNQITQTVDNIGNMTQVNNQIGALTTESFKVNETVSASNRNKNKNIEPMLTEGYEHFANY
jgi:hypothetical protein